MVEPYEKKPPTPFGRGFKGEHKRMVNKAIRNNSKGKEHHVMLTYRKEDGTESTRKVTPYTTKKDVFIAKDHSRDGQLRSFKLERIVKMEKTSSFRQSFKRNFLNPLLGKPQKKTEAFISNIRTNRAELRNKIEKHQGLVKKYENAAEQNAWDPLRNSALNVENWDARTNKLIGKALSHSDATRRAKLTIGIRSRAEDRATKLLKKQNDYSDKVLTGTILGGAGAAAGGGAFAYNKLTAPINFDKDKKMEKTAFETGFRKRANAYSSAAPMSGYRVPGGMANPEMAGSKVIGTYGNKFRDTSSVKYTPSSLPSKGKVVGLTSGVPAAGAAAKAAPAAAGAAAKVAPAANKGMFARGFEKAKGMIPKTRLGKGLAIGGAVGAVAGGAALAHKLLGGSKPQPQQQYGY